MSAIGVEGGLAIKSSGKIEPEGKDQVVYCSSFLTSHGPSNTLWAGRFDDDARDLMFSYTVADNGDLVDRPGGREVPQKTQGLVVTGDLFIYSTSHGRNNRSNIIEDLYKVPPSALEKLPRR